MNETNDFPLVPMSPRALEKARPGAKRILSGMVTDTLALARVCNNDLNTLAQEWEGIPDGLREAAQAGDSEAQFKFGEIHFDRRGYIKGPDGKQVKDQNWYHELRLAFQWFSRAAAQGHAQAQCQVAWCYGSGWGVDRDTSKQIAYLRLAGENGCSEAWRRLGDILIRGTIYTKPVPQEGLEYVRKAAEIGDGLAANFLSRLYRLGRLRKYGEGPDSYVEGIQVATDIAESIRWLRKAADSGDRLAQQEIAGRYFDGDDVTQDFREAHKWASLLASTGDSWGQSMLGELYENGYGVPKDYGQAVEWYRKAAWVFAYDDRCPDGAMNLARCYIWGRGVLKDLSEAYMWLSLSAQGTVEDAQEPERWLIPLRREMSPSELADGERRFQDLLRKREQQFEGL